MASHEEFAADVARSFAFLESDYGMVREPVHVAGIGCWVTYANPQVKVVVEREIGGYCGVSVQNLRHVKKDPLERSEFDLDEIVAVANARQPRRPDPRSMTEVIARAAETLRSAGASVLKGDFEALHARQKKLVEAVRKHTPLAQN